MLAATNAYLDGYIWSYNKTNEKYYCTRDAKVPLGSVKLTTCNRVTTMPFGDYLTRYFYGHYSFIEEPSILGIHIEKILNNRL